jgi:hypothetical protein
MLAIKLVGAIAVKFYRSLVEHPQSHFASCQQYMEAFGLELVIL